jgi:hypothetical protein
MKMHCWERPLTLNALRAFSLATLIVCQGSAEAVVPAEPQTDAPRRYSQDGLEMDLPGDWQAVAEDYDAWNRTFRSAATRGEVNFIVWLPLNARNYLGSFESFVKEWLPKFEGRRDVKRLRVSGLEAVRFSELERRETWIGVPDPDAQHMGTVFSFSTTVQPSEPGGKADLIAYERMLASMRIDPVLLHQAGLHTRRR